MIARLPGMRACPGTVNVYQFTLCLEQSLLKLFSRTFCIFLIIFDNTKTLRKGSVISCRNFLLAVCFHKHSFPLGSYSLRKLSELTKIDRRVLSTHMKSKELLKHICYKPFSKTSPSNYWGKREVSIFLLCG